MTDLDPAAVKEGVAAAFWEWLEGIPVSPLISEGVHSAVSDWLDQHGGDAIRHALTPTQPPQEHPMHQMSNPPVDEPHDIRPVQPAPATPEPRTLTVRIQPTGAGTVHAAGVDISNVVAGVSVTATNGSRPAACLRLEAVDLRAEVDTDRVSIPRELCAALLALGWTPPAQDGA